MKSHVFQIKDFFIRNRRHLFGVEGVVLVIVEFITDVLGKIRLSYIAME